MGRALVTGAGHRLGAAMAIELAQMGYDVAVHYAQSRDKAEQLCETIKGMGRQAVALQADLLDGASYKPLIKKAKAGLGGALSVLINNASIFEYDTFETATEATWDRHMSSNLRAPFFLSQAFAEQVEKGGVDSAGEPIARSCIINMCDQRVRKPTPEFATYTLAKMGLWALTQTSAQAMAPDIRVNAIGPGPTLQGGRQTAEQFARQRGATVLKRGANTDDITAAMRYILMSPSLTGQLLCIDGGQHLSWQTPDVMGVE